MWRKIWNEIRKFGIIRIVLIAVLIALCIFVQLPSRQNVAEASKEGVVSEENTGSLGRGSRARQRIYFKKDVTLYSIDMRFDMQDNTANTEFLTVYIRDKKMNEIARKRVYTKDMKDGEMTRIRFSGGIALERQHSYYVIVTGPELKEGEVSPAVRLASFSSPNKRLYVGGSLVKNQSLDTVYNYQYDDSFNALGMYIAGLLMILILLVPRWFWKRLGNIWGIGWALFFANPIIVLQLTLRFYELQDGRSPQMHLYNCMLLLCMQCILYAVIGNKYVSLMVQNILCFLLTIVNLQVSIFKGVPLLPSDFLFLKTAFEVSENYKIEWTHTQIHFMLFMFVYVCFIFVLGSYRHKEGKKESLGLWSRIKRRKKDAVEVTESQMSAEATAESEVITEPEVAAAVEEGAATETMIEDVVSKEEKTKKETSHWWKRNCYFWGKMVYRIALLIVGIYGVHYLYSTTVLAENGLAVDIWNRNKSYKRNGVYLEFFMNFHYLGMEKPEGYSVDRVKKIVETTTTEPEKESKTNEKTGSKDPNIIIIMNESLADYTLLDSGEAMTYNEDYLPYIHSLEENVIKGKCYVSVFGGQTANSEFECLTGNSLAFLPASSVPYQQFIKGTTFSLPIYLETLGYQTTAIHPCVGTNWNREEAYASMNFGKFLTQNDFKNPEYVRYISDEETYNKIIQQFEEKEEEDKLFIMGVTMQNHGGYTDNTDWDEPIIAGDGEYPLANEYLSSARVSDKAYQHLLKYFSNYDEPTVILMFGDHQPAIDDEFLNSVLGGAAETLNLQQIQEKYCTPYILWANYDIETQTDGVTSTNFLSNLVLEQAGLPLSRYNQFIGTVQEDIEAMNAFGYRTKDGIWHTYEENTEQSQKLDNYNIAEYGYFSDKDEKTMGSIFGLPLKK